MLLAPTLPVHVRMGWIVMVVINEEPRPKYRVGIELDKIRTGNDADDLPLAINDRHWIYPMVPQKKLCRLLQAIIWRERQRVGVHNIFCGTGKHLLYLFVNLTLVLAKILQLFYNASQGRKIYWGPLCHKIIVRYKTQQKPIFIIYRKTVQTTNKKGLHDLLHRGFGCYRNDLPCHKILHKYNFHNNIVFTGVPI